MLQDYLALYQNMGCANVSYQVVWEHDGDESRKKIAKPLKSESKITHFHRLTAMELTILY